MAPPPLIPLFLVLVLVVAPARLSAATATTIPLYRHLPHAAAGEHHLNKHPLARLAAASLARATHLRNRKDGGGRTTSSSAGTAALYPHSYGGYAFTASLGTPAQQVPVLLDTGSHLSWVPCTSRYQCRDCLFASQSPAAIAVFHPNQSSTARLVGCRAPACTWLHHHSQSISNCSSTSTDVCPPYAVVYGSGSTAGLLIADTLRAPLKKKKDNLVLGCSLVSVHQPPSGLAGFGRGAPSLPAQLGLDGFSYCLLSRRFDDDAAVSGQLVLLGGASSGSSAQLKNNNTTTTTTTTTTKEKEQLMQYAPFVLHTAATQPYSVYYYLALTAIAVAGKPVRLPERAFLPSVPTATTTTRTSRGVRGGGGAIVDSGTTFTYLDPTVFRPVAAAMVAAVGGRYNRSKGVEAGLGLRPCFALPRGQGATKLRSMELPELSLRFRGGAEMRLPVQNYFVLAGRTGGTADTEEEEAICLAVITDVANGGRPVAGGSAGPAIILGSFQQQNYYVEYDLRNQRLGFRRQPCASSTS